MNVKIGSQVGNWLVISEIYKEKNISWNNCQCICGIIRPVRTWWLNHRMSKGCGCTNIKGRFKSKCVGDLSSSYFTSFKKSRISKGISFDDNVTIEFLWDLFIKQNKKCAISGIEILMNPRWSKQNKGEITEVIQTASLDRINNNLGYTIDNVQWVHKDVNMMRGGLSVNDFIFICKKVTLNNIEINIKDADFTGKRKYYGDQTIKKIKKNKK
jgi:hypothetical protein